MCAEAVCSFTATSRVRSRLLVYIGGYMGDILGIYWGYIGVILGLYRGYIGIMEKKMETTT